MSESDEWPPYPEMTDDQQKRYRRLLDKGAWGDAFTYNQLTEFTRKLGQQMTALQRMLWLEVGLLVVVIAILLWLTQVFLEFFELLVEF